MTDTDQINKACAEILGWQRYDGAGLINWMWAPGHFSPAVPRWCMEQGNGLDFTGPALMELPDYCTDPAAALQLVQKMAEDGWDCDLLCFTNGRWGCTFHRGNRDGYSHTSDSFCMAICESFLKANQIETP